MAQTNETSNRTSAGLGVPEVAEAHPRAFVRLFVRRIRSQDEKDAEVCDISGLQAVPV